MVCCLEYFFHILYPGWSSIITFILFFFSFFFFSSLYCKLILFLCCVPMVVIHHVQIICTTVKISDVVTLYVNTLSQMYFSSYLPSPISCNNLIVITMWHKWTIFWEDCILYLLGKKWEMNYWTYISRLDYENTDHHPLEFILQLPPEYRVS